MILTPSFYWSSSVVFLTACCRAFSGEAWSNIYLVYRIGNYSAPVWLDELVRSINDLGPCIIKAHPSSQSLEQEGDTASLSTRRQTALLGLSPCMPASDGSVSIGCLSSHSSGAQNGSVSLFGHQLYYGIFFPWGNKNEHLLRK